jgi:two-component system response regulator DegU
MKLLIVDDNAETRKLIRTVVRKCSEDIIEGRSGMEAVASYIQYKPDWVLMDIEMAGMDGLTATRKIKSEHPEAKIIMVTMHDDPRWRLEAQKAGAIGYVLKENLTQLPSLLMGS